MKTVVGNVISVMNCPKCGQPVAPGSAFCPHCGNRMTPLSPRAVQNTAAAGTSALQTTFDAQRKKSAIIASVIAGVVLIVAIIFGGKAIGSLMSGSKADPNANLVRSDSNTPNMLQVRADQPAPLLNRGDVNPPAKKMPPEVLEWLKHLERCEAKKVAISGDQAAEVSVLMSKMSVLGAGMGLMNPYDQSGDDDKDQEPSGYAKGKILDLRPDWEELIRYFNSVPPPAECKPIADDFNRAIYEIPGMMGDLGDVLNGASSDPDSALKLVKKMQHSSYGDIDRYFERCDQKISTICDKYDTHKWFNVKGDVLAGGMMGKFSGIGGGGMGSVGDIGGN